MSTSDLHEQTQQQQQQQQQQLTLKQQQSPKGKKVRNIMEAASALTSLLGEDDQSGASSSSPPNPKDNETTKSQDNNGGDEEKKVAKKEDISTTVDQSSSKQRFIPEHKKPDAALTFPEKLMNLMKFADQQNDENYCVAWLEDGKSFVIRHPDEFTRKVLPHYFKATKFSSFTRKLYRWGFRQVNRGIGPDDPIIFGNEFFQRDNEEIMAKMRSITAASSRKQEVVAPSNVFGGSNMNNSMKRPFESSLDAAERDSKRALLDQLIQHKAAALHGHQSLYGAQNMGGLNLTSALRPNLGGNGLAGMGLAGMGGLKPYDMMGQGLSHQTNPLLNSFRMQHNAMPQMNSARSSAAAQSYPSAASTADIVNAAINALRFG